MKIKKDFFILPIILCLMNSNFTYSQEIDTDRPDQTDSPETLIRRRLQVETGFSFEKNKFGSSDENFSSNTLTSLIRYGLFKKIELKLNINFNSIKFNYGNLISIPGEKTTFEGFIPLVVGTKIKIIDGKNILPKSYLSLNISIPKFAS